MRKNTIVNLLLACSSCQRNLVTENSAILSQSYDLCMRIWNKKAANHLIGGKYEDDHFILRSFYEDETLTFFCGLLYIDNSSSNLFMKCRRNLWCHYCVFWPLDHTSVVKVLNLLIVEYIGTIVWFLNLDCVVFMLPI